MELDCSEQLGFFNPKEWSYPIQIVGAGGNNNMLGVTLARMGVPEIHIWDDDVLEKRNYAMEPAYVADDLGRLKVEAMRQSISRVMAGFENQPEVVIHPEKVTAETELNGIVVTGVDSMASRKAIWQAIKRNFLEIALLIDTRSGGTELEILVLSPVDVERVNLYETTQLYDDDQVKPAVCGSRVCPCAPLRVAQAVAEILSAYQRGKIIDFQSRFDFGSEFSQAEWLD